jgi:hypothetical protein
MQGDALARFHEWLTESHLYVFTLNGFPYGTFHRARIKEHVYSPDWLEDERVVYTNVLTSILAELLPAGIDGSVSTVPGAFRPRATTPADYDRMAEQMMRSAASLHELEQRTGKLVRLAFEPEPCCAFETSLETVSFFRDHLAHAGVERLARERGWTRDRAEDVLRRHLSVCLDACHLAVEFETPKETVETFAAAGIKVAKIQLSTGLQVSVGRGDVRTARHLRELVDDVYLHQVVEDTGSGLRRYVDLPEALATIDASDARRTWRIHLHVPIFADGFGPLANTQPYLRELLAMQRQSPIADHLEVETYTWDVLPREFRGADVVDDICRELEWAKQQLER